jgi:hypothetical protein
MATSRKKAEKRAGGASSARAPKSRASSPAKKKPGTRASAASARKSPAKPRVKAKKKEAAAAARPTATRAKTRKAAGAPARRRVVSRPAREAGHEAPAPGAVPGLSDEDQIRAAKYLPRELPRRVFEEERFVFPESYGANRVRLLVRDPEWIFAYWDVDPGAMKDLGHEIGERALALSRLTLRVADPVSGGSSDILLPPGARWWYVRTDSARRTYRAQLGVTLPSGEFRSLAESNTVVTPRVGPSAERAGRRLSYPAAQALSPADAEAAARAERARGASAQPWAEGSVDGAAEPKGGASDTFRPGGPGGPGGASDVMRPGASDSFRR